MFQLILLANRLQMQKEQTPIRVLFRFRTILLVGRYLYEEPSLESCSIVYCAGCVAKKYWDKFVCIDLTKNNEHHPNNPSANFNTA